MSSTSSYKFYAIDRGVLFACGATLFFAVGVQYLMLLLVLAVCVWRRGWTADNTHSHQKYLLGVVGAFLLWVMVVLAMQPSYFPQTPSHAVHAVRLALTLVLFMWVPASLARTAIYGAFASLALVLLVIVLHFSGLMPASPYWAHLVMAGTNKSIGASILVSMMAVLVLAWLLSTRKWTLQLLGIALLMGLLAVLMFSLGKRTALLGLFVGSVVVVLHQYRQHRAKLLGILVAVCVVLAGMFAALPSMRHSWVRGLAEVQTALQGEVNTDSWNVRVQMIRHSVDMALEKPWMGWGVGSWNTQWQARVPEALQGYNMPHNDFLWLSAETGWLGGVAWVALMLAGLWRLWPTRSWQAAAASAGAVMALVAALVNNGTRDATLGLPMLMLVGLMFAWAFNGALISTRSRSAAI